MSKKTKYIGFHNIYNYGTIQNETYIGGTNSNGEDVTLVFNTIDLLEWLDINHMKEEAKKYINELNK